MLFSFRATTDQPVYVGEIGDGWVTTQVVNGTGVYVGKTAPALRNNQAPPGIGDMYDGFFIAPSDGIVKLPWTGEVWIFWPDRTSDVYGVIDLSGCV